MKNSIFVLCLLSLALPRAAHAKGILPSSNEVSISTATSHIPVLIGEKVPENLVVLDSSGTKRTLLSYKAAIEVLVVEFLSPRCETDQTQGPDLRRFYESYKNWHVAFVAVNLGGTAGAGDLQEQFAKAGMKIPVVQDPSGTLRHILKVKATPEILIMDEDGFLMYRGPMSRETRPAINAVIGHTDPVPHPEPAMSKGCPVL